MRKSFVAAIIALLLTTLIVLGVGDVAISAADTAAFNNEVTDGVSRASNSSASATITITMTGIADQ